MNPDVKAKWVEALRSGKYQQAASRLRTNHGHCCLGVLCDLFNPNNWQDLPGEDFKSFLGRSACLPTEVMNWAGMEDSTGSLPINSRYDCLAAANDKGVPFPVIANLIETHL